MQNYYSTSDYTKLKEELFNDVIPEYLQTQQICDYIRKGFILKHVPAKYLNETILICALDQYIYNIYDISPELITESMCLKIIERKGNEFLFLVPMKFRNYNICVTAIKTSPGNIRYVPHELKTKELCELTVSLYNELLQNNDFRTSGHITNYIPKEFKYMKKELKINTKNYLERFFGKK
jgi:hypothetical protein